MNRQALASLTIVLQFLTSCSPSDEEPSKQITGSVETIAGSGSGFVNGPAASAKFNEPAGLTVDTEGNVYVADFANNAIRKITPAGDVSTFAGGSEGNANGTGTEAQFNGPHDIEIGTDGNFYVVEVYGNRIRKITPDGVVSNFAGSTTGELAYVNATGNEARFYSPRCLAVAPDGSFYVTEFSNRIRKITAAGVVTTFAGSGIAGSSDGVGESATFDDPMGIATDLPGNVYVAQYQSSVLRKITPAGEVSTLTNSGSRFFHWPADVIADHAGNCFVGEVGNFSISLLSSSNKRSVVSGTAGQGTLDGNWNVGRFDTPYALHFDKTQNIIYVSDLHRIRKVTLSR